MTEFQERILAIIQNQYPIAARPYAELASMLDVSEDDVLQAISELRESGVIRRIGANFNAARLGYATTLVGAVVPEDQLGDFVAAVNDLPGVSHNYRRRHKFNVWFTLTMRGFEQIDELLDQLRRQFLIEVLHSLPAQTVYKLDVTFRTPESGAYCPISAVAPEHLPPDVVELSDNEKALVRALQRDLSMNAEPFAVVAEHAGWPLPDALGKINQWKRVRVIRRLGATLAQRRIGLQANGMAVFDIEAERVDEVGAALARYPEITHCYRRPRAPDWPYDVFAMLHCENDEQLQELFQTMIHQTEPRQADLLVTMEEYKKSKVRLFEEA